MARKKAKSKSRREQRASWKGNLTFGLVSFAVEAYNALDRQGSDIHFHQLHAKCHRRIHYQKVCPEHGEITNDEIVSGYEYQKGKYIEIDPEELDALRPESERALKIDAFISPETIDPLYFDGRMYYLLPAEKGAQESYGVMVTAMEREERYGVGQVVFSGKDQLALIRPVDHVLHMAMLNFEAEIRRPDAISKSLPKPAASTSRQVRLAQTLIKDWADDNFDFSDYEDSHREQIQVLIDAKVKGREIVTPEEESDDEPATINLMDALKKSLGQSHRGKPAKRAVKTHKRSSA